MTDLNDYFYTDGVHDVLAAYINALVAGNLRGELSNVEALATDKALTNGDFPSQFLDPDGTDRLVTTPEAGAENHLFFITHTGSANTITVKNSDESVTLGVLAAGEVMLAVSGGATADYAAIKTADAVDLTPYLLKTGLSEWDEQGSNPSTPAANKWKLYFKSGGLYLIDDAGAVTGPLASASASVFDMLSTLVSSEVSITGADTANWGKQHVVSGSSNYTVAIAACSGNAGKFLSLRITNTGITTIDPNSSETIDGVASRRFFQDTFLILYTDGSNVFTVAQKQAPRGVVIPIQNFTKNSAVTGAALSTQYCCYIEYQSSAADADWIECNVFLQKGTYTCECLGFTQNSCGKMDWTLNGVSQTTGQDWYSSGSVVNVSKTFTLTVPYTGYHTLKGTINGKNGSSSSYSWVLTYVNIYPSAY